MRDEEMINQLLRLASDFWYHHVLAREAPPVDDADASTTLLSRMYPEATNKLKIQLEQTDIFEKYFEKKKQVKHLEEEVSEIENQMKSLLGEYEIGVAGSYKVKWENRCRTSVDSKKLKAEYPSINQACVKNTPFRQFSIKKEEAINGQ